ncbi:hypothetical protein TB1_026701 [Malus domestica]
MSASEAKIVFLEGDDCDDELGKDEGENEAEDYRLEELLLLSAHCFFPAHFDSRSATEPTSGAFPGGSRASPTPTSSDRTRSLACL